MLAGFACEGFLQRFSRGEDTKLRKRMDPSVRLYLIVILAFSACVVLWARKLGLSWPVRSACSCCRSLIEFHRSLTDWWRLSTVGLSIALLVSGLGFPFVSGRVLFGAAIFIGSMSSAAILRWQILRPAAEPNQTPGERPRRPSLSLMLARKDRRMIAPIDLEGGAIRLTPLRVDHVEELCAIGLDPSLWRSTTIEVRSRADMESYIRSALDARNAGTALPFCHSRSRHGRLVGTTRFHSIVPDHKRLEIGFTWSAFHGSARA